MEEVKEAGEVGEVEQIQEEQEILKRGRKPVTRASNRSTETLKKETSAKTDILHNKRSRLTFSEDILEISDEPTVNAPFEQINNDIIQPYQKNQDIVSSHIYPRSSLDNESRIFSIQYDMDNSSHMPANTNKNLDLSAKSTMNIYYLASQFSNVKYKFKPFTLHIDLLRIF